MPRNVAPVLVEPPEPLERVQERLWFALPSIVALRTAESKGTERPAREPQAEDIEPAAAAEAAEAAEAAAVEDPLATALVPFAEVRQAAECLFAACHRNPVAADVAAGVSALLGPLDENSERMCGRADIAQLLLDVATHWLEWADKEHTWRAVSERQFASVMKELVDCVTHDTPPGALLPLAQVLTARSGIARTKSLVTPFEAFVELATPPEFPAIYDTLWSMLCPSPDAEFITEASFVVFFRWFYLRVFSNATEASAGAAAVPVWHAFLNARGRMGRRQFVAACRHMCRVYAQRDDVACLEAFHRDSTISSSATTITEENAAITEENIRAEFFASRAAPLGRVLASPHDLFVPEEFDVARREAARLLPEHSANRIIVCGRRGVGKSALCAALARRLRGVDLNAAALAAEAAAEGSADPLGAQLRAHVAAGTAVPLALRAALIRRRLSADDVAHRGYVFSGFPACPAGGEPEEVRAFFEECGIFDVALPTAIVRVQCGDEALYAERLADVERLASAARAREDELRALIAADTERTARVEELRAAVRLAAEMSAPPPAAPAVDPAATAAASRKKSARPKRKGAPAAVAPDPAALAAAEEAAAAAAAAEEELARVRAAAAAAAEELARLGEVDGLLSRGGEGDEAEGSEERASAQQREATRRAERAAWEAEVFQLTLRRLMDAAPGEEAVEAVEAVEEEEGHATGAGPIAAMDAQLRPLGRCLALDCTSTAEEAVAYIVEALQMRPCILPRDLAAAQEEGGPDGDKDWSPKGEEEEAMAGEREENAAKMGAIPSDVWKRYCPVTFADHGVLVEGTALYGCVYCQRVYYTASAECLERFLADPPRYLRATPLDRAPILLLSTIDTRDVQSRLPSDLADALITRIFEQLKLTSMSFADFTAAWDRHRDLREKRAQALKDRELYEMTERSQRGERLKKRLAAEMKSAKKKKNQPQAPKGKQKKGTATVEIPEVEEKYTGWDASADEVKAISSRIQKRVNASIERRRTFVPILVHAIGPDFSREAFDLLLAEGVLPETIVVLDYARPTADDGEASDDEREGEDDDEEDQRRQQQQQQQGDNGLRPENGKGEVVSDGEGQGDGTTENVTKVKPKRPPPMPQIAAINEIARRAEEAGDERRDEKDEAENLEDRPHRFRVHRFTINDKTADIIVGEILQAICPAMPRIEAGAVDEELGEDDDASNEDEDEFYDDDEEKNEWTPRAGGPLVVPDRAVRPGKRFLNQFGSRLQYCPVTLYEKGLLMKGKNEYCAKYRQELYVFTTEEAQAKFERHPLRYLENPVPYIPPRIWIVGYSCSGKKTLMRHLSEVYDIPCFAYDRGFFERVIKAARTPGGAYVNGIKIPETPADNASLVLAEKVLQGVRDFAEEQERRLQLREAAEAEMERRRLAEERVDEEEDEEEREEQEEEKDEVDEEAEALLQEQLDFEPEADEDRELRLSESYLKITSCVTRLEPFASRGYIMICPPFSEGDLDVLFTTGGVPEVALQIDLSPEGYRARNCLSEAQRRPTQTDQLARFSHAPPTEEAEEDRRAERALHKWRRRHIGADDPDSEVEEANETDHLKDSNDNAMKMAEASGAEQLLDANQAVEQEAISEFAEAISDLLVPVVVLNGELSKNAIYRAAKRQLFKVLEHRRSILHVAEVYRYEDALRRLETGEADLSYFDYTDPVRLYDARHGVRRECKWCPDGVLPPPEEDPNAAAAAAAAAEGVAGASVEDNTRERNDRDKKASAATEDDDDEEEDEEEREELSQATARKTNDAPIHDEEDEDEEMSEYGSEEMNEARDAIERARRRERLRHYQRAALFCGRFYFFDDDASLVRFLRDPLLYTMAPPPPPPPAARAVVAVVDVHAEAKRRGPAEHLALNLGCPLVSLPKLLSWAAVQAPRLLSLARRAIDAVLRGRAEDGSGEDVTEKLIGELLAHRLAGADVRRRGAVLLNLPRTAAQYDLLLKADVRIDKVAAFDPQSPLCGMAVQAMRATAAVDAPAQEPRGSVAALAALMGYIDEFVSNEGCAALCRIRAIPMDIHNTYYTAAHVETHLSPYGWFCPYSWVLCEDLVDQRESQKYGAEYLGVFYFFSSAPYLKRFLATPAEVIEAPGFRAIPEDIPVRIPFSEGMTFELLGCCPVTLYDTRENKGLRRVVEPIAREGNHKCIVQYKGKNYALLDELLLERFMRRPWQYVAGAALPPPRKQPLQAPATLFSIDEEQYIRRTLYDPVAYALTAVMSDRPKYPGLSVEESALKYVALHLKCHNEKNTEIQAEKYKQNYATFKKRGTLYKSMTEEFDDVCGVMSSELSDEWERAANKEDIYKLIHLQ